MGRRWKERKKVEKRRLALMTFKLFFRIFNEIFEKMRERIDL